MDLRVNSTEVISPNRTVIGDELSHEPTEGQKKSTLRGLRSDQRVRGGQRVGDPCLCRSPP